MLAAPGSHERRTGGSQPGGEAGKHWQGKSAGDAGEGFGASHQTRWTGLIADIILRRHGVGEPS